MFSTICDEYSQPPLPEGPRTEGAKWQYGDETPMSQVKEIERIKDEVAVNDSVLELRGEEAMMVH